jgi:hypothetical protein
MTKRIQRLFVAVAALVALAVGGPDTDNIHSGDQATPDTVGASAAASKAAAATTEARGTEQSAASEQPGAAEQPGSESAANDDGPGGHADESGNAAADHQFQGQEYGQWASRAWGSVAGSATARPAGRCASTAIGA